MAYRCASCGQPLPSFDLSLERLAWLVWKCRACGALHRRDGVPIDVRLDRADRSVFHLSHRPSMGAGIAAGLWSIATPLAVLPILLTVFASQLLSLLRGPEAALISPLAAMGLTLLVAVLAAGTVLAAYTRFRASRSTTIEVTATALSVNGTRYPYAGIRALERTAKGLRLDLESGRTWTLFATPEVCETLIESWERFNTERADDPELRAQRAQLAALQPE